MLNDECIGNLDDGTFDENLSDAQTEVAEENSNDSSLNSLKESMQKILDDAEVSDYNDLDEESRAEYDELEKAYNYKLYNNYAEQVYYKATSGETDFDQEMFDYYVNIYKQIQAAGGNCISISDYNGLNGDAATDSDWLTNMVKAGKITIDIVNKDNKTGELTFSSTSPSSDTYVGYTESTAIDSKALAKAEAEYEYKMKQIDQKDEKFDMDLSKLETERTALTTEYDSVKKVIQDNIERTFGIFKHSESLVNDTSIQKYSLFNPFSLFRLNLTSGFFLQQNRYSYIYQVENGRGKFRRSLKSNHYSPFTKKHLITWSLKKRTPSRLTKIVP